MPPSDRSTTPDDVVDVLLWRLAADVAANHQPDTSGRCANLRCAHEAYPCRPARDAERSRRAATRPATVARGRARVPTADTATGDSSAWFHPTHPAATGATGTAIAPWPLPRRQPTARLPAA